VSHAIIVNINRENLRCLRRLTFHWELRLDLLDL
jgi:hypothetical protein